jgi:hypothetical protein
MIDALPAALSSLAALARRARAERWPPVFLPPPGMAILEYLRVIVGSEADEPAAAAGLEELSRLMISRGRSAAQDRVISDVLDAIGLAPAAGWEALGLLAAAEAVDICCTALLAAADLYCAEPAGSA